MDSKNINNRFTSSDEVSLKEVVFKIEKWYKYLVSKWPVILIFGIVGGSLGVAYAYSKKTMYSAATTFVLEEGSSGTGALGNLGGLASMVGVDFGSGGGGIFQGDNILELYRSRAMIEKTLLTRVEFAGFTGKLIERYIEFNKLRESWNKIPQLRSINFNNFDVIRSENQVDIGARLQDSILGVVVKDINKNYLSVVKPDRKLSIIKVEVKSSDEPFTKAFNDEIVRNVNDFYIQTKTKKTQENVNILQQKVDSVRAVMNGAIYAAAAVSDATPNLNPTRQVQRTAPLQRSQFSVETNKVVLGELVKNLEMSKMALLKEAPLIQVVDQPVLPLDIERPGKVKMLFLWGISAGVLIVFFLTIRLILKNILIED